MDQCVIATFKANSLKFTFKKAIAASTGEPAMLITEFWRQYNIKVALEHINTAWLKISESTIKCIWKCLLFVLNDSNDCCAADLTQTIDQITAMGHQLGLNELGSNSVWQTLHANEELDNSELLAIDNEITDNDTSELSTSESPEERQVKL